MDFHLIKDKITSSPAFIVDAEKILNTLRALDSLRRQCACKVLFSIKPLPLSSVMEMALPFVDGFSVSSLFEAQLADEILSKRGEIHLTSPGIKPDDWKNLAPLLSHISFNSFSQYERFAAENHTQLSQGLRLNPKLSFLNDDRFDPCRQYSKLGVDIDELWQSDYLDQIKGLHIHTVFSATSFTPLIKTIEKVRGYFGKNLGRLDWLNLGGGYLFNQIEDHRPFIDLVNQLNSDFDIQVYIEPGKAVIGDSSYLLSTVIDCFDSDGKTIGILDTSINHNPEVFEYQRQPELYEHNPKGQYPVILAGCTCLAGDVFGEYRLTSPLKVGDKILFKQVGAYSLIKANRFNGQNLPDIYWLKNQQISKIKQYHYEDFRQQWWVD